ncbi:hypothetical protein PR003_g20527 [Phytophthora rubi]|uniref:Uncharacterized protein n=1 Tax=Phytophthora rubi TaxID=129364 RepID=A0A6A4DW16_9STRA|nr:hypothetical protein PR003_g20527 [Phytophthora rubi]
MQWEAIMNTTFKKEEAIMPLPMAVVEAIKVELESFLEMPKFYKKMWQAREFTTQEVRGSTAPGAGQCRRWPVATFDDWKSTLRASIQTDAFEGYTRAFMKQLKMEATEHQIIKGWQVYKGTELLKNITMQPLINDLHSEAMQN